MSDEDRTDREGQNPDQRDEADDAPPADDAGADDEQPADESADATVEATTETPDGDAMAHVDDAVAEAVERVAGATASVPSADELQASASDSPDAEAGPADGPEPDGIAAGATDDAADGADGAVGAAGRQGLDLDAAKAEPETRVLEFTLDDEQYCLDIDYIEEIVKREAITRVPNTPAFVEGVVDLRGQITTILNPKVIIGTDDQTPGDLLVVFDGAQLDEQGHFGWVVDDVNQVTPVADAEVNDPPVEGDHIEGVIDRGDDESLVVWTAPDLALDEAT